MAQLQSTTVTGTLTLPSYVAGFVKLNASGAVVMDTNTYITGITSGMITTALGYTPVPTTRTLTINGTAFDLSADRSWTIAAGVSSVTASGAGISASPTTGAVVISNTGVTSNVAGTGISVSGATGAVTITNTGVTSVAAGTGISVSASTGGVTITNTGVTSVNGNTGAITGIITTSNYNSYSPTLTGGGASGTWSINITGTASSETLATVTGRGGSTTSQVTISREATINTTTPGTTASYGLHFGGQTTADYATGITWNGGTTVTNANAGIYVQGSGAYGTRMYIATTDSYAVGSKTAVSINESGLVNFVRTRPTALGNTILDAGNYNSYSPTLTGGGASGTWGINITGNAATVGGLSASAFVRTYGTTNNNIDSDYGECFITFDPVPSGTPPLSSPNIRTINVGNDFNRRTQLAFDYASDRGFFRRKQDASWQTWREFIHTGNYTSYAVQTTSQSNWNSYSVIGNVVGLLAWKNYGNAHVIFDASAGTSPSGGSVNNTNSAAAWTATYPTLMGWNGSQTYGVRVDSARVSDNTTGNSATTSQTNFSALTISGAAVATQSWVTSQGYITSAAIGNGTLTLNVSGNGLSGSTSFTANQTGNTTFTVTSNATTSATANTLVYRDASGHITGNYGFFSYVNTSDNDETGITRFVIKNGDNYHRSATTTTAANIIRGVASGSWSINITGSAGSLSNMNISQFTNDSGYITSSSLSGYLPLSGGQLSGVLYVGTTGSGVYGQYWKDGTGSYIEAVGNSTATRVMRVQSSNGSGSYVQWFMDGGTQQISGAVGGVTNFMMNSSTVYLRYNGSDKFWTGSDGTRTQGWSYYQDNSAGMHWPNNQWHLMPASSTDFRFHSGNSSESSIRMETYGTTRGYVYVDSSNNIGFLNNSRSWSLRVDSSGNTFASGSHRAPIFYDSDDTTYYLDPHSTGVSFRGRGEIFLGPNSSGRYTRLGGNGGATDEATVSASNGNLHIDCKAGYGLYLNYYTTNTIFLGNNGYSISSNGSYYNGTASYANSAGSASTATSAVYLTSSNYIFQRGSNGSWNADFQSTPAGTLSYGGDLGANGTNGPGGAWWMQQNFRHTNSSNFWGIQVAWGWEDNANRLATRNVTGGSFGGWVYYLNSANYTSYAIARGGDTVDGVIYFRTNLGGYSGSLSNARMQAYSDSNNSAFISFHKGGYYAVNMGLDADNWFRIGGWSAASNRLQMDMSGNLYMAGDVTAYSDARVKENVVTVDNALDKVLNLRGVYYNRIDSEDKRRKVGVIAQEIMEVIPEVVGQDNDGMYNVSYGNIVGVLIEAIKEQQKEIDNLKARLDGTPQ